MVGMVDNPGPLLFIHAHPDDKTLATGGTIARYSRAGHDVAIVTCTAGEQGTVPDGEFDQLMNDRDGTLAAARAAEAEAACVLLDAEHRWLGGLFTYRDSGRLGSHANAHPRAFWAADIDEAAVALADTIVAVRPHAIVTYDPHLPVHGQQARPPGAEGRSSDLLEGIQGITSTCSNRQPVPSAPVHPRRSS
jgi:N-acetyl-1-D-myo-inositol-2-amino-2-deoxy-alpha-D-glucopyranoside deacetylase